MIQRFLVELDWSQVSVEKVDEDGIKRGVFAHLENDIVRGEVPRITVWLVAAYNEPSVEERNDMAKKASGEGGPYHEFRYEVTLTYEALADKGHVFGVPSAEVLASILQAGFRERGWRVPEDIHVETTN